jgi:lipopolysaccharide export system permease protein
MTKLAKFPLLSSWQRLTQSISLLDRYVWAVLWPPYLFSFGLFAALTIALTTLIDLVNELADTSMPLTILAQLFFLQLPACFGLALPMAVLLATLIGLGRLSADSELTALKSMGVGAYRLLFPVICFGLAVSLVAFGINETLVPAARTEANQVVERTINQGLGAEKLQNIFFPQYGEDGVITRLFYANRLEGNQLYGLTLLDFSQKGIEQVMTAANAAWNHTLNTWNFSEGTIYFVDNSQDAGNILQFGEKQLQLPRKAAPEPPQKEFAAMTLPEAHQALQQLEQQDPRRARRLAIQIHQRFAIPFQGVLLGIVGTSLVVGGRRSNSSSSRGFGLSFLVLAVQYFLFFVAAILGINGALSPFWAAWLPAGLEVSLAAYWLARHNA